ncbi:MAG TPA: hypothetical protein EYF95_04150 [Flavobacteriales bacterium]|jgi:hypothetical protein|nr:hypothetical protein [Flavobacteriales bacterium]
MKVGDMVRVKRSHRTRGEIGTGIITALKGRSSFSNDVEVFWVLVNGRLGAYGSFQLMKVAS